MQNKIGCKRHTRASSPDTTGDPIAANVNEERYARTIPQMGLRGISSPMTTPLRVPIAGVKMA